MPISFREKNRDPGWFAAAWRILSAPSFLGLNLIVVGLLVLAASSIADDSLDVVGRVAAVVAGGSLLAVVVSILARPRYFGRAMHALGLDRRIVVPLFRDELKPDIAEQKPSPTAVASRVLLLMALVATPIIAAGAVFFDATLAGSSLVTRTDTVDSASVSYGDVEFRRYLGIDLKIASDSDTGGDELVLSVTNPASGETQQPVLRAKQRVRAESNFLALAGWIPTLHGRSAIFRVTDEQGDSAFDVTIAEGQSVDLAPGATLTLHDTRDAFLDLLGPAAEVSLSNAADESRRFWTFLRAPEFDATHGSGAIRLQLLGFEPGAAAVLNVRDTPGTRWDFVALSFLAALVLLMLARLIAPPYLTGRSGDYSLISPEPWFFEDSADRASVDAIIERYARREDAIAADASRDGAGS